MTSTAGQFENKRSNIKRFSFYSIKTLICVSIYFHHAEHIDFVDSHKGISSNIFYS